MKKAILLFLVTLMLVAAALFLAGLYPYKIYVVHTGSMEPTIPPKSAVIVREGVFHLGKVITFDSVNGVVTHRLVGQNPDGSYRTKGDGNETADVSPVETSEIIGEVVAAPRMLGYWIVYIKNPAGIASIIGLVFALTLLYSLTCDLSEPGTAKP